MKLLPEQNRFTLTEKVVYLAASVFIVVLLIVRACKVLMVHDEIATFYYYVQSGRFNPFFTISDTNNHFLNSLLTWISFKVLGDSPLALRLPNLLFIPVYLFSVLGIARFLKSVWMRIALFVSLVFTLHLVEFLALSRGYGMSYSLLFLCFLFAIRWLNSRSDRDMVYCLISLFISSLANLAMINIYSLLLFFILLVKFREPERKTLRFLLTFTIAGILPFLFILAQVLYIKSESGLVAGNLNGFWVTSMRTMISWLFEAEQPLSDLIPIVLLSLIALSITLICLKTRKITGHLETPYFLFGYLLTGSILSLIVLGAVFHVNYPDDRIATYLYVLMILTLVFGTDKLWELNGHKHSLLLALLLALLPVHFFIFLNTSYSGWYKYDVIPRRFYDRVMQDCVPDKPAPTIGAHGLRIFCWSFLTYQNDGEANAIFFTTYPSYIADYQIVDLPAVPLWNQYYDMLDYDPVSKRHLLKLKHSPKLSELAMLNVPAVRNCTKEFLLLSQGDARPWRGKTLQADLNLAVNSGGKCLHSRIVVDVFDSENKSLRYEYLQLNWIRPDFPENGKRLINSILIDQIPEEATGYKIYLWNIDKTNFGIEGHISVKERIVEKPVV